jgi:isoquinoline 1-oxidoreductase subunit beta
MTAPAPTRRDFLQVALLGGGAFALGIVLPGCHPYDTKTAERAEKTGQFSPNAWLTIHPDDRVVFVLDRVEMGQGTMTSQTTLLAEELDVDPRKIHVELAPAHPVYGNPDPDLRFQITGGSTSTRGSWEQLRKAGAAAREMLRAGAAATWGVALAECTAADGAIVHAPSGKRGTYGQFTRAAAHQPIPSPPLKDASSFKWIGKSLERLDGRMKVDGSAIYGIDVRVPGLLRAAVVRSPVFGGKLAGFDAARARAVPGVVDVFEIPSGVAVVAKNTWTAKKAAMLVEARWDEGSLANESSASLRAAYAERARHDAKVVRDDGDFAAAAKAGKVLEAIYEVPFLAHATMEPQNATAHVTDDRCDVWAPTQSPAVAFEQAREILGYAPEKVHVHQTLLGGGFGRRLAQDYAIEAIHISRRLKRPVMVVWSREDDMQHDFYRPMTFNAMKGAIDGAGRISGWFHRIVAQSIVAQTAASWAPALAGVTPQAFKPFLARTASHLYKSELVHDETASEGAGDFTYAIKNLRVEYAQIELGIPVGFWRSVGHSENAFMVESFIDELAHAAKRDPLDVRRELLQASPRHLGVLDLAVKKAGYGAPAPPGVFRGIAVCKSFHSWCAQVAEVEVVDKRIKVRRVVAAIDCGIVVNPDLVRAQVESAIVFGLSAALKQAITLKNGRVEQTNFNDYPLVRMFESPEIEVHIVPSREAPTGVGEPGLPPVAPAVANAVFLATGKRLRSLPLSLG